MRGKGLALASFLLLLAALLSYLALATDIDCHFFGSAICDAGYIKVLGVENDTGGYNNAHVQNYTLGTYANSLCCNTTDASVNITPECSGNFSYLLFRSGEDNAHLRSIDEPYNESYPYYDCFSSDEATVIPVTINGTCGLGSTCMLSMASSEGDNWTNAHVADCLEYDAKICLLLYNFPPAAPPLVFPDNGNTTITERDVNFIWNMSTDNESQPISYTLNATCGAGCPCSSLSIGGINDTNYTVTSDLCVDVGYNWSVTACDIFGACNTSAIWNFSIESILDFTLIVNATDFGGMGLGESKQTSSTLQALVGRNDGNVKINATINASALFSSVSYPSSNYLYKAADNETGSIVAGCSQTTLAQMTDVSVAPLFCNLSWVNSSDEVKIDINVTVPNLEQAGEKTSTIIIDYESAE